MYWIERHWYGKSFISLALSPLSWIYCLLALLRRQLYRLQIFHSIQLPVPVIVIGNITVGGTGKTPLVLWLAGFLLGKGYRPGIVTRGYRGNVRDWPILVQADSDPGQVGDEPLLLARLSAAPVMAGVDRVRAARRLVREHGCDVIVSDDGLQHYHLRRDVEIAVIDGSRRFGNGRCLPAGPLREPMSRLRSVDACITQGTPPPDGWGMRLEEKGFHRLDAPGQAVSVDVFRGRPVHAVAGIGRPERFFDQLRGLGLQVIEHPFPDHHRFHEKDLSFGDDYEIIMTQKDAVKCERFSTPRIWYLAVEARVDPRLGELVLQRMKEKSRRGKEKARG